MPGSTDNYGVRISHHLAGEKGEAGPLAQVRHSDQGAKASSTP